MLAIKSLLYAEENLLRIKNLFSRKKVKYRYSLAFSINFVKRTTKILILLIILNLRGRMARRKSSSLARRTLVLYLIAKIREVDHRWACGRHARLMHHLRRKLDSTANRRFSFSRSSFLLLLSCLSVGVLVPISSPLRSLLSVFTDTGAN